ncbi:MAG: hypothetical protein HDR98_01000 [Bacteroides sp.]|nr:hypothetical protein [Bacteroides sp.]
MTFSEILNILLGGGLLGLVAGVITLKAAVRKANAEAAQAQAEAKKAEADAEGVRITNTENATRILVENIVKPLKEELNATRSDLQATKREMASTKREMQRLRKAVESASNCPHSDGCPVLLKLRDNQKDSDGGEEGDSDRYGQDGHRHGSVRNKSDPEGNGALEQGGNLNQRGQPP